MLPREQPKCSALNFTQFLRCPRVLSCRAPASRVRSSLSPWRLSGESLSAASTCSSWFLRQGLPAASADADRKQQIRDPAPGANGEPRLALTGLLPVDSPCEASPHPFLCSPAPALLPSPPCVLPWRSRQSAEGWPFRSLPLPAQVTAEEQVLYRFDRHPLGLARLTQQARAWMKVENGDQVATGIRHLWNNAGSHKQGGKKRSATSLYFPRANIKMVHTQQTQKRIYSLTLKKLLRIFKSQEKDKIHYITNQEMTEESCLLNTKKTPKNENVVNKL